jgi:hypothetical protein
MPTDQAPAADAAPASAGDLSTPEAEEFVVDDPSAVVVEAELSGAPPGCTARLILDLGHASVEAAALARDLARGMLGQIEAKLADPATDLSAELRGALVALAGALSEHIDDRTTVTLLNTPLTRAWHAHPARWER